MRLHLLCVSYPVCDNTSFTAYHIRYDLHRDRTHTYAVPRSFWKPRNIPSAQAFDVLDHQFEAAEVPCCNCVECDIQQDECPLEESINRVRYHSQYERALLLHDVTNLLAHGALCAE